MKQSVLVKEHNGIINQSTNQPFTICETYIPSKKIYISENNQDTRPCFARIVRPLVVNTCLYFFFFQIALKGQRGQSYQGDIALDDLTVSDGACPVLREY